MIPDRTLRAQIERVERSNAVPADRTALADPRRSTTLASAERRIGAGARIDDVAEVRRDATS